MRRFAAMMVAVTMLGAAAAARGPVAARAKPDFSGTWSLDVSRSEGPMLPTSATLKVTQTDKALTVERTTTAMGTTRTTTMVYSLDGSTSKNTVNAMGNTVEFTSTTEWADSVLVIHTTAPVGPGLTQTEKWSLSDDKKTLTLNGDAAIGPQAVSSKQTFVKQ